MDEFFKCFRSPRTCLVTTMIICFNLIGHFGYSVATKIHYIHWNSTNPIFRMGKSDNVIDINSGNHPWEYDQVNIVCPVYKAVSSAHRQEKYVIYSVSKEEYESCRITQPNPKIIALCNRPHDLMYFTITFRSFTPTPGGLEFRPGQNYYFISTSSRGDIHRRVGGSCSSNNMKVVFRVADKTENDGDSENNVEQETIRDFSKTKLSQKARENFFQHPIVEQSPRFKNADFSTKTFYYPQREISATKSNLFNMHMLYKNRKIGRNPKFSSFSSSSATIPITSIILVSITLAVNAMTLFF